MFTHPTRPPFPFSMGNFIFGFLRICSHIFFLQENGFTKKNIISWKWLTQSLHSSLYIFAIVFCFCFFTSSLYEFLCGGVGCWLVKRVDGLHELWFKSLHLTIQEVIKTSTFYQTFVTHICLQFSDLSIFDLHILHI